jgi:flagellar hook assembly protein FlgD
VFSEELQKLFYFWDGKSEKKRKVGTGTYTASIRITTISEKTNRKKTTVQKVPLGILRK